MKIFLLCFFIFSLPFVSLAQPMQMAAGCHCFKDRSYDPAQKFAADDYILATSFNSMLARFFDISKRQIIMLRMQKGVDGKELTTSLYLGKILAVDFNTILSRHSKKQSWKEIVASVDFPKNEKYPVIEMIRKNGSDQDISHLAAKMVISKYFAIPAVSITKYNDQGLSDKEVVLVMGLSSRSGQAVDFIVSQYADKGKSWGEIADSYGIAAAEIGAIISSLYTAE